MEESAPPYTADVKEGISEAHRDMKLNCPRTLIIATVAAKPKKEMG